MSLQPLPPSLPLAHAVHLAHLYTFSKWWLLQLSSRPLSHDKAPTFNHFEVNTLDSMCLSIYFPSPPHIFPTWQMSPSPNSVCQLKMASGIMAQP